MDTINFTNMDKDSIKVTVANNLKNSNDYTKKLFNYLLNEKPGIANRLHKIYEEAYNNLYNQVEKTLKAYLTDDEMGLLDFNAEFMEELMNWPLDFLGYEFTENERFVSQFLNLTRVKTKPHNLTSEN